LYPIFEADAPKSLAVLRDDFVVTLTKQVMGSRTDSSARNVVLQSVPEIGVSIEGKSLIGN